MAGKVQKQKEKRSPLGVIAILAVLLAAAVFAITRPREQPPAEQAVVSPQPAPAQEYNDSIPAYFEDPAAAEPLPATLAPETVKAHARAAYEVAQRKPKLLTQLPCYCYCDRFGHTSLHTCYVTTHAEDCDVCMKEAIEADQMDSQGLSGPEIRKRIVKKYHHHDHSHRS